VKIAVVKPTMAELTTVVWVHSASIETNKRMSSNSAITPTSVDERTTKTKNKHILQLAWTELATPASTHANKINNQSRRRDKRTVYAVPREDATRTTNWPKP